MTYLRKLTLFLYLSAATVLLGQKPLGIDVSNHQGSGINWTSVKGSGISFAWCKATQGSTFTDGDFTINEANAKAAGVFIGAYDFAAPAANTPTNEASYYWGVAKNYIANGGYYMMPMLDYEDFSGHTGATSHSDWINQWCTIITNLAYAKGVVVKPVLYTSSCSSSSYLDSSVVPHTTAWIANYNGEDPQSGNPWSVCSSGNWWGGPGTTGGWTFWQYSSTATVPGVSGNCDVDVFYSTSNLLSQYVIGGTLITAQPSSRYADPGSSLTMRIGLSSTTGATYQWRFNGSAISGATKSTLTLTNIQTNNAGSYSVVIGGTPGTATSSNAVLTVFQPYAPVFSDNFDSDSSANWNVNTSTSDNRVTFAYDYSAIGVPAAPNSSGSTKGLRMEANLSAGAAAALSVSPKNQGFTGNYRLHFDMWINVNGPLQGPATGGGTGSTEGVTAGVGTSGSKVEWNGLGSSADGAYFFVDGDGDVGSGSSTNGDFGTYLGTSFIGVATGSYTAGTQSTAKNSTDHYYQTVFPGGQSAPTFQKNNFAQQTGTLAAGTVGLNWHDVIVDRTGNAVTWYIDGLKIASVNVTLVQSNIFVGYWDPFSSVSDNTNLSFGIVDNLRVEVPAVAPGITAQPASLTAIQGSNATFTVTATAVPSASYQWRFNSSPIASATDSSYTIANVQTINAGSYSVIVSNSAGSVTSSNATLKVFVPPTLTSQPSSQTVNVGANTQFLFTCTGSQPLSFQWTKDNAVVPGATSDRLTLTNIQPSDAGTYVGTASNGAGSASTSNVVLTVVQLQTASSGFSPEGLFQLTISGAPGAGYTIDGSTNLIDWFNIATLTNDTGTIQFTDSESTNYPQLFYRVSAPTN